MAEKSELEEFLAGFAKPTEDGGYDLTDAVPIALESRAYSARIYYLQTPYGWVSSATFELLGQVLYQERLHPKNGVHLRAEDAVNRALLTLISIAESNAVRLSSMSGHERDANAAQIASRRIAGMLQGVEEITLDEPAVSYPLLSAG